MWVSLCQELGLENHQVMSNWENLLPSFRWPVTVVQRIAAPSDKVWDAIAMPGNLESCHPYCARNPVQVWPGPEARDRGHYLNGVVFERRFCGWFDGAGYDLNIGRRGGASSFVSWRMRSVDPGHTDLRISVYPYVIQNLPVAIRWVPHIVFIRPMLMKYLSSVTRGFEWYVTREEPVPRNQFGSHRWFS